MPTRSAVGWDDIEKVGLGRLGKLVGEISHQIKKPGGLILEGQGSSCGSYNPRWLKDFHLIASGFPMSPLPAKSQRAAAEEYQHRMKLQPAKGFTEAIAKVDWPTAVKILFPSERFVTQEYVLGPDGAGAFFGKKVHFLKNG